MQAATRSCRVPTFRHIRPQFSEGVAMNQPQVSREEGLTWDQIEEARQRLSGVAHRTPVLHSRQFDEAAGCGVFLKAENLQRGGAFKFRGAYNKIKAESE